jgi:murein DD-endopeptidase MepM/ murein hydrolase activator NlpD
VPLPSSARVLRLSILGAILAAGLGAVSPADPVAARTVGAATARPQEWSWPVAPPHAIVAPYRVPATRYSAGHRGIDIAAVPGETIVAPADGTVHFAGIVVDRPVLSVRHAGGFISSYEPVTTTLVAGDRVLLGDEIGTLDLATRHCISGCLHFGVRLDGEYVSPLLLLEGLPRSILLPTRAAP